MTIVIFQCFHSKLSDLELNELNNELNKYVNILDELNKITFYHLIIGLRRLKLL